MTADLVQRIDAALERDDLLPEVAKLLEDARVALPTEYHDRIKFEGQRRPIEAPIIDGSGNTIKPIPLDMPPGWGRP